MTQHRKNVKRVRSENIHSKKEIALYCVRHTLQIFKYQKYLQDIYFNMFVFYLLYKKVYSRKVDCRKNKLFFEQN